MSDGDESGSGGRRTGDRGSGDRRTGDRGSGDRQTADGRTGRRGTARGERSEFRRFMEAERGPYFYVREVLTSALIVGVIGLTLFGASGVWPPMVAVESGSMEPHMQRGDLVFVTEPERLAPDAAVDGTGVVPHEAARETGYRKFGGHGSVIVFDPPSRQGSPIIHRAHLWVEEGENWYDRADREHVRAEDCEELTHCPAPHDGFITKGDNNPRYDQVQGISPPVRSEWVRGVARVRVPYLGWVKLLVSGATVVPVDPAAPAEPASSADAVVLPGGSGAVLVRPGAEPVSAASNSGTAEAHS